MRRMFVVPAQQIEAVVVAVRRPDDRVNVKFGRFWIGQEHAGMVVELDESHRTLYPVIEWTLFREAADPAEMGVRQMALDFGEAGTSRTFRQHDEVFFDQV